MYNIRAVSNALVTKPANGKDGPRAGPPFEMPYSMALPPGRADAWRLHIELIDAAATLVDGMLPGASREEQAFLNTMAAVDGERRSAIDALIAGSGDRRSRLGGWS
jgi:hypothetical protein